MNDMMNIPTNEKGVWLHTHLHREGGDLVATGYLVIGHKTQIFEVRVDVRRIIGAVVKAHARLHQEQGTVAGVCVGCGEDDEVLCVGCDEDEIEEVIGSRRTRRKARRARRKTRRVARKARRSARRTARRARMKVKHPKRYRLSRKLRNTVKKVAKSKVARGIVMATAAAAAVATTPMTGGASLAALVPVGAKAIKSIGTANKVLNALGKKKRARKGVRKAAGKLGRALRKFGSKVKRKLLGKARRKGLFSRFNPKKIGRAIGRLAKKVVGKRLGRVLKKAPQLKNKLYQARESLYSAAHARKQIRGLLDAAPNNAKARKAKRILATVAQHRSRLAHIGERRNQRGVTGMVIDDQGRIKRGNFERVNTGTGTPDVLYAKAQRIQRGHFHLVSGDAIIGADPLVQELIGSEYGVPYGPVAGELVGAEPAPGYNIASESVAGCVGCGTPAYPVGNLLIT